mmetsp:Transcript_150170/g.482647  ORF Transcript_150170/g.482647 Transcript_150170/m.482647 type:complete len:263 (+) Transcript_150170:111-899(+)
MMQQALAWGSSYVDGLVAYHAGCCCSTDPRSDSQGGQKCGDLVVMSDWDTDEHLRHSVGYAGNFHEPTACRAMEPGSPALPGGAAFGASPERWDTTPRGAVPQTPRAASAGRGGDRGSPSPLGYSSPPGRDPDEGSSDAAAREAMALRDLMKKFVQEMVHGRQLPVVIGEGRTESCKLTLTPNLLYLQLEAAGVTHDIPLRNVKDVCPGRLTSSRLVPVELDDLCNTLVLRNNECVTFRLSNMRERDEFTKCVKVLALALDQ